MELIIFYGFGVISVSIAWLLYKGDMISKQNDHMLDRLQHHLNISSLREADYKEKLGEIEAYIGDINSDMKKDSYNSVTKQNQKLNNINKELKRLQEVFSMEQVKCDTHFKSVEASIKRTSDTLDALRNDPNLLSRY